MLILINGRPLIGKLTGIGNFTKLICKYIPLGEHEYKVIVPAGKVDQSILSEIKDKVVIAEVSPFLSDFPLLWHLFVLPFHIRKLGGDIYIETSFYFPLYFLKVIKKVLIVYDLTPLTHRDTFTFLRKLILPFLFKRSVKHSSFYWFISEFTKKNFFHYFKEKLGSMSFTGLSVESLVAQNKSISFGRNNIIAVGTIDKRKNYEFLLKIAKHPKMVSFNFHIAGMLGNDSEFLKKEVSFTKNFKILGRLDDSDLSDKISSSTLLISTSLDEGFGMPVLEAFKRKVPVVVPNHSAFRYVVRSGGVKVLDWNVDEWVEAILEVSSKRDLYSQKAFEDSKAFCWSNISKNFKNWINKI